MLNPVGNLGGVSAFAITPSDTVDLTYPVRAIYVGVGGDVSLLLREDTDPVLFKGMVSGAIYTLDVIRVYDTDTDATDIVGLR